MPRGAKLTDQLCWKCQRATGNKDLQCPWFRDFTPIKGWTAEPTNIRNVRMKEYDGQPVDERTENIATFAIFDCPMFLKDKRKRRPIVLEVRNND